jgi:hypothetical protein
MAELLHVFVGHGWKVAQRVEILTSANRGIVQPAKTPTSALMASCIAINFLGPAADTAQHTI